MIDTDTITRLRQDEEARARAAAEEPDPPPAVWAHVELMGHVSHWGKLSEEEKFGVKMGRLDIPQPDGSFATIYFGGASVYRITIVAEAVARHMAPKSGAAPVSAWDFPKMLPKPDDEALRDAASRVERKPLIEEEWDDDEDEPPYA